jgi:cytoplasmic iron level regulating protein YaaA (DUF328/UPF0246 family)
MLFLLSPAKALDFESPACAAAATQPLFVAQAAALVGVLRQKTPAEIAHLMDLSDALATLNVGRYQAWEPTFAPPHAKPALLAFNGDVYDGLQAKSLSPADLRWAQDHVRILSGLYGALRPLDLMRPYRLEMGTRLATPEGNNLYQFWGRQITDHLNEGLAQTPAGCAPVVVNLASEEYSKAVDKKALQAPLVNCVFEEHRGQGQYKIISFMAKRARGLMLRHAITQRARSPADLQGFDAQGYAFVPALSDPLRLVFRRDLRGSAPP